MSASAPWKGEKEGEPSARCGERWPSLQAPNSSSSRFAPMVMALRSPMNIVARAAAARASPTSTTLGPASAEWRELPGDAGRPAHARDRSGQADPPTTPQTPRGYRRGTAGVRLFHVSDSEHVVSAVRLEEPEGETEAEEGDAAE